MEVRIEAGLGPVRPDVEVVERKGRGHPDTLCDAVADAAANALATEYQARFGAILHHNVDKVLLVAGSSRPALGGGEIIGPIELTLAGRATREVAAETVDVDSIVIEAAKACLRRRVPRLDVERHVRFRACIGPGAAELVGAFMRQAETGVWVSNDTSIGVGHAPLSPLERSVLEIEERLTTDEALRLHPERGVDMKVMGVRVGKAIQLTIADAFVGGALRDLAAYEAAKVMLVEDATGLASQTSGGLDVHVRVNAADDVARGQIYLTVTGTSAECGDDGEAGRGNRASGLITPMRPMTMESTAGKNPVSHVGKIYNVIAGRIAHDVAGLDDVTGAEICLVSRIGAPVAEPQLVHARVWTRGRDPRELRDAIAALARDHLSWSGALAQRLVRGELRIF